MNKVSISSPNIIFERVMTLNYFLTDSFPKYIQKEIENLHKLIMPLAQKTSKYMFWTYPLIGISIFNIVYLLFLSDQRGNNMYILLGIYAILGALGLALLKEIRLNKKEIEKIGRKYMIDRITKSYILSDERKDHYIKEVNQNKVLAMEKFVAFLQEEYRLDRFRNKPIDSE